MLSRPLVVFEASAVAVDSRRDRGARRAAMRVRSGPRGTYYGRWRRGGGRQEALPSRSIFYAGAFLARDQSVLQLLGIHAGVFAQQAHGFVRRHHVRKNVFFLEHAGPEVETVFILILRLLPSV